VEQLGQFVEVSRVAEMFPNGRDGTAGQGIGHQPAASFVRTNNQDGQQISARRIGKLRERRHATPWIHFKRFMLIPMIPFKPK
jgi:hypothetical protein